MARKLPLSPFSRKILKLSSRKTCISSTLYANPTQINLVAYRLPFCSHADFQTSELPNKSPTWDHFKAHFCSATYDSRAQMDLPKDTDYDAKIEFLRNQLLPANLIQVLGETSDLASAMDIFKWASLQTGFHHTTNTYRCLIMKLGLAGKIDEMEGFCVEMAKRKCPGAGEALVELIDAFVTRTRLQEATRVVVVLISGGYKPSMRTSNALMGALVEGKSDLKDVLFVYKEMVKAGMAPNVDTLNYLLKALFDADRIELALVQYKRMDNKGCCPNSRTFEIVISGLIAKHRIDESVTILNKMFEVGCEVDLPFYNKIIPLFCEVDRLEEVIGLYGKMRSSKIVPDLVTYGILIRFLSNNFRVDDAVNVLGGMMEDGLTPSIDVFVEIINGFCRLGRFDEARNFLEDKNVCEASPYNELLGGYLDAGKFLVAKHLFDKMIEKNIDDRSSWNIFIRCICENVGFKKGFEILSRMFISDIIPDATTFSALIVGSYKMDDYELALYLFNHIRGKDWVLDSISYAELIESLCKVGKIQEASEVFGYISGHGHSLESFSFNMLIKGVYETRGLGESIRLRSLAYRSGSSCSSFIFNTIMLGLFDTNKLKDILVVLAQMLVEGCAPDADTYCILVRCMNAQRRTRDGAMLFNLMISEGLMPEPETLTSLFSCLASQHQLHAILAATEELISNSDVLNSSMFNLLINGLWKEGYKDKAHQLLDLMLEKSWVPDAATHALFVGSVAREAAGEEPMAREISSVQDDVSNILVKALG